MAILTVGAGQQYATIAAAIAATQDGDTVLVQAGVYVNDYATIYHKITLQSVGGLAIIDSTAQPTNGKGIFTTETDVTINGFGFTNTTVADGNGAGIRYEGGNLVVENSVFWNNQDGILANNDPNGTITILSSEFSHNGAGDGYSHGIYVNQVAQLTVENSYFHDTQVGHEIKSRALATTIIGNRIQNNATGSASYDIDLPDGGVDLIQGNVIEKGPDAQNPYSIHFGGEGTPYANSSLTVTGNTLVNDLPGGTLIANQTSVTATLSNNLIWGYDAAHTAYGPVTVSGDTTLAVEPVLNTSSAVPTTVTLPAPGPDASLGTALETWGPSGAVVASGRVLTVGARGTFHTLGSALAASQDGDTILVQAGTYTNDVATINHKVIIEGVGGIAHFVQTGFSPNAGLFIVNADATLQNLDISGASNIVGYEAGVYLNAGHLTISNSDIHDNQMGIATADNASASVSVYNSEFGANFNVGSSDDNFRVGMIDSLVVQGSYIHGGSSDHELSDRAFNTDIENTRIIDGAGVTASFLIDLGFGGAATIANDLLVKGPDAVQGVLVHAGGEGAVYEDSNVQVENSTLISQYSNSGHPYSYFVVGDTGKGPIPVTATNDTFVGGVTGSRALTGVADGGGNVSVATTTTPINTSAPWSAAAAPGMFGIQGGMNTLTLTLAEDKAYQDAQFLVMVDGVGVGGGMVTASHAAGASQTMSFAGTWAAGPHQVSVSIVNPFSSYGGGAGAVWVESLSLDGSTVSPNVSVSGPLYTTTLTASSEMPGFDAAYYLAHNPDVAKSGMDPLQHYLTFGWKEGRDPSALFDTSYYLKSNPDVAASGMDPLLHYDEYGWHEGRDPSLLFSTSKYLAAYPDVANAAVDPLGHYESNGQFEGRMTFLSGAVGTADPLVDATYYDKQLGATLIPTGTAATQQAQASYDATGWQKGLNPDQWFDTNYYLSHNPDVAAAHIDPLLHYETFGWKEGRDPSASFSTNKYLAANADVRAAGMDPLLHYVDFGQSEGRAIYSV